MIKGNRFLQVSIFCFVALGFLGSFASPSHAYKLIKTPSGQPVRWTQMPVSWSYNHNSFTQINSQTMVQILQAAFKRWEAPTCNKLSTKYLGATTSGWNQRDQKNTLVWSNSIPDPQYPRALALMVPTYNASGAYTDSDIIFNNTYSWSTQPTAQQYDILGTTTHEIGHLFGLAHSQVRSASMFARANTGVCPCRKLSQDDISGICKIYPSGSGGTTGKKKLGESCSNQNLCVTGLVCTQLKQGATTGVCLNSCQTNACTSGKCYTLNNGVKVCACQNNQDCGGKTCQNGQCKGGGGSTTGNQKEGQSCNNQNLCISGLSCVQLQQGATSGICFPSCPSGTCSTGEKCHKLNNGQTACACQNNSQCSGGKTCTNYRCKSGGGSTTGNQKEGQSCNNQNLCVAGLSCVQLQQGATTGTCFPSCPTGVCATGEKCHTLTTKQTACACRNNTECSGGKTCIAFRCKSGGSSTGGKEGEACQNGQCQTGLKCLVDQNDKTKTLCIRMCKNNQECIGGRTCNTQYGVCVAKAPTGTRDKGQKCDPKNGCKAGLICGRFSAAETSGTCMPNCTTAGSCSGGEKCHPIDGGQKICVCTKDEHCSKPNTTCKNYECVAKASGNCQSDLQCPSGKTCKNGKCIQKPTSCTSDSQCPAGNICKNGGCVQKPTNPGCTTDLQCPAGQKCNNGKCELSAGGCKKDTDCKADQRCLNGNCEKKIESKCIASTECPFDHKCESGICKKEKEKGACEPVCGAGFYCKAGTCAQLKRCKDDSNCKHGFRCRNSNCFPSREKKETPEEGCNCQSSKQSPPLSSVLFWGLILFFTTYQKWPIFRSKN